MAAAAASNVSFYIAILTNSSQSPQKYLKKRNKEMIKIRQFWNDCQQLLSPFSDFLKVQLMPIGNQRILFSIGQQRQKIAISFFWNLLWLNFHKNIYCLLSRSNGGWGGNNGKLLGWWGEPAPSMRELELSSSYIFPQTHTYTQTWKFSRPSRPAVV